MICVDHSSACAAIRNIEKDGRIFVDARVPVTDFDRSTLGSMIDWGNKRIDAAIFVPSEREPHFRVETIAFVDQPSGMHLAVTNWKPGPAGRGYVTTVTPADVQPRKGSGIHWAPR